MSLKQPMLVEPFFELKQRLAELLDGIEGSHPQQLLLQGSDKPLSHAVALWCPNEAGTRFNAEKPKLLLEGMTHVLRTMVVTQHQALGNASCQRTIEIPNALVDRLQGLETCARTRGMDADHITHKVIYSHKNCRRSLSTGMDLSGIGAPHPVRAIGDD
jgi:hypothetical protein